jgi:hypothetical protein
MGPGMPDEAIDLKNPDEEQVWYLPTIVAAYAEVGRMDDAHSTEAQIEAESA